MRNIMFVVAGLLTPALTLPAHTSANPVYNDGDHIACVGTSASITIGANASAEVEGMGGESPSAPAASASFLRVSPSPSRRSGTSLMPWAITAALLVDLSQLPVLFN
ncbi:hypothetical protein F4823DRAFT_583255 [Ustulina deusta]|nr:hypothetical protein F4823DRAFT_583255 [Ustulina deusta]